MTSLALTPEFSDSARGIASNASANFLMAYCSSPGHVCSGNKLVHVFVQTAGGKPLHPRKLYLSVGRDLLG